MDRSIQSSGDALPDAGIRSGHGSTHTAAVDAAADGSDRTRCDAAAAGGGAGADAGAAGRRVAGGPHQPADGCRAHVAGSSRCGAGPGNDPPSPCRPCRPRTLPGLERAPGPTSRPGPRTSATDSGPTRHTDRFDLARTGPTALQRRSLERVGSGTWCGGSGSPWSGVWAHRGC